MNVILTKMFMILSISKIYVKVENLNIIYNCLYFLLRNTIGLIQCPMFVTQFYGMFHADGLASYIKQLFSSYDFDVNKMVSQGCDSASVMSSCCAGIQTRVREFVPYAIYIH